MDPVRVRFAPSPTGYLHVGGARTALFNWLLAKQTNGSFVLRIEDTDLARSTKESVEGILEGMRFLGLDWDEGPGKDGGYGPYFQSERLHLYKQYAEKLLASGRAYECFCTAEELDEMRKSALEKKEAPRYDGRCRKLSNEELKALKAEGKSSVIRFKADQSGQTVVDDIIRGRVTFENTQIDDFVIFKSDGMPTYNFAVVIDDGLMEISHVIRGEDHLSNTPKQIQIYQALGFSVPRFAHIPMILGPDKARLSKRHGATSVTQFRDEGYLPQAMVNYLALLGWGYDATQTMFTVDELVEKFSLERVSKNPAVFDIQKLEWMNGVYIRELDADTLYGLALPFWQAAGLVDEEPSDQTKAKCIKILSELQSRMKLLNELPEISYYFFTDDLKYNEKAVRKVLYKEDVPEILAYLLKELVRLDEFTLESLESVFKKAQQDLGIDKLGKLMQPVRVAVTGTNVSPGIYEVLMLLGPAKSCQRLKQAAEMAKAYLKEGDPSGV